MTLAELMKEAEQLSPEERLTLAHYMLESLEAEPLPTSPNGLTILDMAGFLKPDADIPTDQDVEEMVTAYLEEKISVNLPLSCAYLL